MMCMEITGTIDLAGQIFWSATILGVLAAVNRALEEDEKLRLGVYGYWGLIFFIDFLDHVPCLCAPERCYCRPVRALLENNDWYCPLSCLAAFGVICQAIVMIFVGDDALANYEDWKIANRVTSFVAIGIALVFALAVVWTRLVKREVQLRNICITILCARAAGFEYVFAPWAYRLDTDEFNLGIMILLYCGKISADVFVIKRSWRMKANAKANVREDGVEAAPQRDGGNADQENVDEEAAPQRDSGNANQENVDEEVAPPRDSGNADQKSVDEEAAPVGSEESSVTHSGD